MALNPFSSLSIFLFWRTKGTETEPDGDWGGGVGGEGVGVVVEVKGSRGHLNMAATGDGGCHRMIDLLTCSSTGSRTVLRQEQWLLLGPSQEEHSSVAMEIRLSQVR